MKKNNKKKPSKNKKRKSKKNKQQKKKAKIIKIRHSLTKENIIYLD